MLWAALRFPDLSLQLYQRGAASCGPVIVQEADNRPVVWSCNEEAVRAGIKPGMPVSAAYALTHQLNLRLRNPAKEMKALAGIAAWATQFTPTVSLASANEVLIEISGCLRLFGGLRPLSGRIRAGLAELGYRAVVVVAPTPTAALLLARDGVDTSVGDRHQLRRAMASRVASGRAFSTKSIVRSGCCRTHACPLPRRAAFRLRSNCPLPYRK